MPPRLTSRMAARTNPTRGHSTTTFPATSLRALQRCSIHTSIAPPTKRLTWASCPGDTRPHGHLFRRGGSCYALSRRTTSSRTSGKSLHLPPELVVRSQQAGDSRAPATGNPALDIGNARQPARDFLFRLQPIVHRIAAVETALECAVVRRFGNHAVTLFRRDPWLGRVGHRYQRGRLLRFRFHHSSLKLTLLTVIVVITRSRPHRYRRPQTAINSRARCPVRWRRHRVHAATPARCRCQDRETSSQRHVH